ncbi:MAG: type II CAAX endopeptidase family protein [Bacteroidota bacterium]
MIPSAPPASDVLLNGSWERSARSLNTAALLGLLGIGILYFNAQSILALIAVFVTQFTVEPPDLSGGYLERFLENIRHLANPLRTAVVVSQYVFMLLPALLLVRYWHSTDIRRYIRLARAPIAEILLALLATLMIIPSANFIADELVRQLGVPRTIMEINAEIFTSRSLGEFLWLVFVVCITPALCEEIFFRGFVQRTFERTVGWKSVVLVGVIFGLFHFSPLGLIPLSILGMLFGYFFYRSKSLLPPMLAHFANNVLAVYFLYKPEEGAGMAMESIPLWLVGVTLPVGIAMLYLYERLTGRKIENS